MKLFWSTAAPAAASPKLATTRPDVNVTPGEADPADQPALRAWLRSVFLQE
jgi:hypothetical protein